MTAHRARAPAAYPDTNKDIGAAADDVQRALQRRADPADLSRAAGRGRLRAAHRLRQRRQPAARALRAPRAARSPCASRSAPAAAASSASCWSRACCSPASAACSGWRSRVVGIRLFDAAVADVGKPYWIVFTIDLAVFGYFAAICVATGIVFGLAPALQVSKTNINELMKEGGRGSAGGVKARRLTSADGGRRADADARAPHRRRADDRAASSSSIRSISDRDRAIC